uniref:Uncharacterized protein n=1 Tax=Tetraselmis sp. GSL018 TaxID=582737 RepID=A0A061SFY5_9CHLO
MLKGKDRRKNSFTRSFGSLETASLVIGLQNLTGVKHIFKSIDKNWHEQTHGRKNEQSQPARQRLGPNPQTDSRYLMSSLESCVSRNSQYDTKFGVVVNIVMNKVKATIKL